MREALEAVAGHKASTESLAQMTLVRANWEPISRRYLQQAEGAKDPALASSLHGSVAEFYLKYRPDRRPRARPSCARAWSSIRATAARPRTSSGSCARRAGATSCSRSTPAGRAGADARRAHGRRGRGRRAVRADGARPRRVRPLPQGARGQPVRAARAARRPRRADRDRRAWTELGQGAGGGGADQARRAGRRACSSSWRLLFGQRLNQPEMAEPFFRRVRKLDPSNREMVEFYRAYYTARNELPQLLAVLAQAQKTETDLDRRVAMGIEMARAAEQRPQNAEKAIEIWKGLLRLRPHLPEAVASLRKLYTATEKWNALLELLKDDLDAVPAGDVDERIKRHLEIVAIYRDRLNLDVMVVNTYLNILALKPDHPAALAALAARYEAQGRYGDLVQILARQAEAAADPAARVALHRRIAALWADKLGKHQNAVASFEKIFEADPTDAETGARLKDLYTKARAWRPLIEVLRKELPHSDAAGRRARLGEMARLAGERLNDTREAIALYNQVLAIEARDEAALAGLATLYERERRWPALVEILERQRQNAEGNAAGRAGAARAARDAALRADGRLRGGHRGLPAHPGARSQERARRPGAARDLRAGRRLHRARGAVRRAGRLRRAVRSADVAGRSDGRHGRAHAPAGAGGGAVAGEAQSARARAQGVRADPGDRPAQPQGGAGAGAALPRGAEVAAPAGDLRGAAGPGGGGRRRRRWPSGSSCSPRRAGSPSSGWARRRWPSSGARAPSRRRPRTRTSAPTSNGWPARPTSGARWRRSTTPRFAASTDAEERIWLLRRVLRISATRLFKPQDTRRAAEQILAEVGYDEEADGALETVLTQGKAWPELAKLLHARADRAPDAAERVKLLLRIAQIEEERVADLAAAAATWAAILDVEPTNERACRALVRVSEARQDWPGVVEALRGDLATPRRAGAGRLARKTLKEREELLLRIGQPAGDAAQGRRRDVRLVPRGGAGQPVLGAGHRRPRAAGGGGAPGAGGHRAHDAAALRADRERRQAGRGQRGRCSPSPTRWARRSIGWRSCARSTAVRSTIRPGPTGPAWRCSRSIPTEVPNREALLGFATAAGVTGELGDKLRAAAGATDDKNLRRDLLVVVAELRGEAAGAGAARRRRSTPRSSAAEPLHAGAFRALGAPLSRRPALDRAARAARRAPAGGARRARAAGSAGADRRAGRGVARRSRSRARGLREDAGARSGRSARPPRARAALRRAGALDRSRSAARHAGRLRLRRPRCRSWSSGAPTCGPADWTTSAARSICWKGSSSAAPNHEGARRLLEKLLAVPAQRQRVAQILAPVYEASGAWARLAAVLEVQREVLEGPEAAALLARVADLQENKLQARAVALTTWRQVLAADPEHPDALAGDRAAGDRRWSGSPSWSTSTRSWRSGATPPTSAAAPICCRARRSSTPGGSTTGGPPSTPGSWSSTSIRTTWRRPCRPRRRWRRSTPRPATSPTWSRRCACEARWADGTAARKKLLFRIAGLEEKSLGDTEAAVATLRSILELDPQDRDGDRRARSDLRGGGQPPPAGGDPPQADRPGRRRVGAAGALAQRRQPAGEGRGRRRRGDRRLRQHPRREPRGRSGAGDAGAALRAAGAPPRSAGDRRAPAGAAQAQGRRAARAAQADRQACWRGRSAIATGALERWREVLARAPGDGGGAGGDGAVPGAGHRRRPAPGRRAGAGADLREGRALAGAGGDRPHLRRGAGRRARAPRRADAAGGARGDAARRRRGGAAHDRAGDPRRAGRAGAADAARRLRAPGRPPARRPR